MRLMVSVSKETGDVLSFDETYIQAFRCYERLSGLDATLDRPVSDLIGATPEFKPFESEFDNMSWDHDLGTINRRTVSTPPYYFRILIENAAETEYLFQNDCIGLPIVVSFETEPDEGEESPVSDVSNTRYFRGVILKSFMRRGNKLGSNRLELCAYPDLWAMSVTQKSRVWPQVSGFSVLQHLKTEYAVEFPSQTRVLDRRYKPSGAFIREAVIQWQETDFEFVSRLLERDGQYYSIIHKADQSLIYVMSPEHPTITGLDFATKPLRFEAGNEQQSALFANVLLSVSKESQLVARKYSASDYNPLNASASLSFSTMPEGEETTALEVYDYPADAGEVLSLEAAAMRRNQAIQNRRNVHILCSKSPMIMPGCWVDAELDLEALEDTALRPTQVVHELVRDRDTKTLSYLNWFEAIPAKVEYAPMVRTAIPSINGTHNATVVSNTGLVADIDDQSRALVVFRWDRARVPVRVRLGQPWAGGSHGISALPRHGDEVLVSFIQGNTERPVVITSLHNSQTSKKYEPTKSTPLGFQGDTNPGVERSQQLTTAIHNTHGNAVYFNEAGGDELVKIDAAKDFILEIGSKTYKGTSVSGLLSDYSTIDIDSSKTGSDDYPNASFKLTSPAAAVSAEVENSDLAAVKVLRTETATLSVNVTSDSFQPSSPTPATAQRGSSTSATDNWKVANNGDVKIKSDLCKPFGFEIDCTNQSLITFQQIVIAKEHLQSSREIDSPSSQTEYLGTINVDEVVAANTGYIKNIILEGSAGSAAATRTANLPVWAGVSIKYLPNGANEETTAWTTVDAGTITLSALRGEGAANYINFKVSSASDSESWQPESVQVRGFCYPHYSVNVVNSTTPLGSFQTDKAQRGTGIIRTYGDFVIVVGKKTATVDELREKDGSFDGMAELGLKENLLPDDKRGDFKLHVMGEMDQFAEAFFDSNYSPTHGILYDATYKGVIDFAGWTGLPVFSTASMSKKFNVDVGGPKFDFDSGFKSSGRLAMGTELDFGGTLRMNDLSLDVTWSGILQVMDALIDGNSNKFKARFAMWQWEAGTTEHVIADAVSKTEFVSVEGATKNQIQTRTFHAASAILRGIITAAMATFFIQFTVITSSASDAHGADDEDGSLKHYLKDILPSWSYALQIFQYIFLAIVVVSGLVLLIQKTLEWFGVEVTSTQSIISGIIGTNELASVYSGTTPFKNYLMQQSSGIVTNAITHTADLNYLKKTEITALIDTKIESVTRKITKVEEDIVQIQRTFSTYDTGISKLRSDLAQTEFKASKATADIAVQVSKMTKTQSDVAEVVGKLERAKVKFTIRKGLLIDFS
jgi:type VI secretion system VgrG family protein